MVLIYLRARLYRVGLIVKWEKHCFHVFVKHMGDHILIHFCLSVFSVWNQIHWKNLQTIVLLRDFLNVILQSFDDLSEFVNSWMDFSETCSCFPRNFLGFRSDTIKEQSNLNLSIYSKKTFAFVVLSDSKATFSRDRDDINFYSFLCCVLFVHSIA